MSCFYCTLNAGPPESEHFIRFVERPRIMIFLHRDQTLPGRVVVATREHFADVTEMPWETHDDFFRAATEFGRAIKQAYPRTEKINLALCGSTR